MKYTIDDNVISEGEAVVYEGEGVFTPDQLAVLCDLLNQGYDDLDWEGIAPIWEQECARRGIDTAPPT